MRAKGAVIGAVIVTFAGGLVGCTEDEEREPGSVDRLNDQQVEAISEAADETTQAILDSGRTPCEVAWGIDELQGTVAFQTDELVEDCPPDGSFDEPRVLRVLSQNDSDFPFDSGEGSVVVDGSSEEGSYACTYTDGQLTADAINGVPDEIRAVLDSYDEDTTESDAFIDVEDVSYTCSVRRGA